MLVGDRAYASGALRERLSEAGFELITPTKRGTSRTLNGREAALVSERWRVQRAFAWLAHCRRLLNRFERRAVVFEGLVLLACVHRATLKSVAPL